MGIRHSSRKEISKKKKCKDLLENIDTNVSTTPSTVDFQEQYICKGELQVNQPSFKCNNGPPKPCAGVYSQDEPGHQNNEKEQLELNDGYINLINPITVAPNHCDEQAATDEKENGADLGTESISVLSPDEETGGYDRIDGVSAYATEDSKCGISTPGFDNIEYFKRSCNERTSQRTTSSNADSAYTDSTNNTHCCNTLTDDYFCLDCLSCRNKNMEYMTDVYKRTLQRDLQVSDVIHDLHFIDELTRNDISKKAKESGQAAVEMLLEAVKSAEDDGKWQTFIEALEHADYRFLVKLLKGETENDQEKNKKLLSLLSRQLINNINIDECLDKLYENELLNENDKEIVEAEKKNYGPIAAAYKMFNIVPTRSPEWNQKLSEILEQFRLGDIATLLQFANEEPPESKSNETNIKERKVSHRSATRHYCHTKSQGHEVNRHKTHYRTQELHVWTEESKRIADLSKHALEIDVKVKDQFSVLTKLKNELKDLLTKTANDTSTHAKMLKEQEVSLADIKSELRKLQSQHEKEFVELKTSLSGIKNSISALTKLIDPSPPEACKKPKMVVDSGFSGSSGSIPDKYLEDQVPYEDCKL